MLRTMDFRKSSCPRVIRARLFASTEALSAALADMLRAACASGDPAPHGIMLAGGSTPMAAYARVAALPPTASPGLHLLWSDDRHVPAADPRSNYGNMLGLVSALGIPPERVLQIHGELPLQQAAARYNADVAAFFDKGGRIRVGILGLGSDGHTASLFTPEDVARADHPWAVAVQRPDGLQGVSVTPAVLRKVERIVFVVAGAEKKAMAEALLRRSTTIAAGLAIEGHPAVELWTDPAAWPF